MAVGKLVGKGLGKVARRLQGTHGTSSIRELPPGKWPAGFTPNVTTPAVSRPAPGASWVIPFEKEIKAGLGEQIYEAAKNGDMEAQQIIKAWVQRQKPAGPGSAGFRPSERVGIIPEGSPFSRFK